MTTYLCDVNVWLALALEPHVQELERAWPTFAVRPEASPKLWMNSNGDD